MRGTPNTRELAQQHLGFAQKTVVGPSITPSVAQFVEATAEDIGNALESLEKLPPSRERSLVRTKLDEAMMWLQRATPVTNEESRG